MTIKLEWIAALLFVLFCGGMTGVYFYRRRSQLNFKQELEKLHQRNLKFTAILQFIHLDWEARLRDIIDSDEFDPKGRYRELRQEGQGLYRDLRSYMVCDVSPVVLERIKVLEGDDPAWIETYFQIGRLNDGEVK